MVVVETNVFTRLIKSIMDDDEYKDLQTILVARPDIGDIIPGSGGLRKVRWKSLNKGKSGGVRVIYYWVVDDHHIRMLYVFEKSDYEDLSKTQLKQLREIVQRWS